MTRQMPFEPLPASVLLNESARLKRFRGRVGFGVKEEGCHGFGGWEIAGPGKNMGEQSYPSVARFPGLSN